MASTSSTQAAIRWQQIIDRHEASSLSIKEFASANDLNPRTLSWWRWNLGRTTRRRPSSPFVELVVAEAVVCGEVSEPAEPRGSAVAIALGGFEAQIVVDHGTDLPLVRRVLEALC